MGRVFVTGDKHGDFKSEYDYRKIEAFCNTVGTTQNDVMIVLGDHGVHYDGAWSDEKGLKKLSKLPITFVMIRGNHDRRPIPSWRKLFAASDTGHFYEDPLAENVLYTHEYGWYTFGGVQCFVIGGAYSVDKYYRLEMANAGHTGYKWFYDEQLDEHERDEAQKMLFTGFRTGEPITIMSHTCPLNFKPTKNLIAQVDQSTVDDTMERWMDTLYIRALELGLPLTRWYCGHWHIDKTFEPMRFMYHDIEQLKGTEPWRRA